MLKNLLHPLSDICVKLNLLLLTMQVKKMESERYLNLQSRIDLAKIKQKCMDLNQKLHGTPARLIT